MDLTAAQLLVYLGQALLVGVVVFALASVLVSHLRYEAMLQRANEDEIRGTGDGQALRLQMAESLRAGRRTRAPLVVLLVELDRWGEWLERHGAEAVAGVTRATEEPLRTLLRAEDVGVGHGPGRLAFLLQAPRATAEGVARRLQEAAKSVSYALPDGGEIRPALRVGLAGYPEDGQGVLGLYARALDALGAAAVAPGGLAFAPGAPPPAPAAEPEHPRGLLDELTGVLREERLGSGMHKYVAQVRRDGGPASVLCVDIDRLGRYNAQYGEAAGDELLRGVSALLQRLVREQDLIGRCEGDQFVITLAVDATQALRVGQRLVAEVRRASFSAVGLALRLTVSVGVAGHPDVLGSARHLFEAAEAAAREAKEKGGSQCVLFAAARVAPSTARERADAI